MSSIEVMSIKGIRAFSPDNDEKITFYKPLTLIVGHNGAGKTTIIECLKLASTGDLPPNVRSGQNFIHDPKVAGEAEVKAQIRMRFKAPVKGSFMVIRNFSLSQKRDKLTFKSLDSTLSIWNPEINDFNAIPHTCSNINQEVPFSMGVNKAILENVIFVHQEESNWPLDDGKAIKQRFDDIFAATKYTKALEDFKKLKNKQQTEAREKRLELETLRNLRDQANLHKNTIKESEEANRAHSENISMLRRDIEVIDAEMESLRGELQQISLKKSKVSSNKAKFDILSEEINKLKEEMLYKYSEEDLNVTLEELQAYQEELTTRLPQQEASMKQIKQYISEVESEIKTILLAKEGIVKSYGKIMGQADSYRKTAESLVGIGKEICKEFEMDATATCGDHIPPKDISQNLLESLLHKKHEQESQINEVKAKQREDEQALQETIDNLSTKISGAAEVIRLRQEKVATNSDKYNAIQKELSQIDEYLSSDADAKHKFLNKELEDAKQALQLVEEELRCSKHEDTIQKADQDIRMHDMQIQQLRSERSKVAALGESLMRNTILVQEVDKLKEREEKFRALHGSKVAITLGIAPSSIPSEGDKLLTAMKSWISNKESEQELLNTQYKSVQQNFAEAEANLKSSQNLLRQVQNEAKNLEIKFQGNTTGHPSDIEASLTELQQLKEDKSKKVNFHDAYSEIWNSEMRYASDHSSCMSCQRNFETDDMKLSYINHKKSQIDALPAEVSKDQAELEQVQVELERLRILEPDVQRYHNLKSNIIPDLEKRQQECQDALMKAKVDLTTKQRALDDSRLLIESSRNVLNDSVIPWCQLLHQISEQKQQIRNQVHDDNKVGARSIELVDDDLTKVESLRLKAQSARDDATRAVSNIRERVSSCRDAVHNLQQSINASSEKQNRKTLLQSNLTSLIEDSEIAATVAAEKSRELEAFEGEKALLSSQRERIHTSAEESLDALQKTANSINNYVSRINALQSQLSDENPDQAAEEMKQSLSNIEEKKASLEHRLSNLKVELEENIREHQETLSFSAQVEDILRFKHHDNELQKIEEEMKGLGVDMSIFESESNIQSRLASLQEQRAKKQSEADISAGSFAAIEENSRKAKELLRSPMYTDISERYISQLTEVQTVELATSDLEKYYRALEKALLEFHSSKMDDINKTIKELWQKTYRGVDIDYIQIKADSEGTTSRSSYNYRVVMYVGGAELDMRGRCSAGQKVLSCLIVRLALAENFCLNCGVLALDEPTTNLDAENSASLAEALKSLMVARKDFESFQLIVITHDEEFARRLGSREYIEHLWRITKDENQHSRITREPIG